MAKTFTLARTRQCAGCPWKKAIDPNTIPDGFQPTGWAAIARNMLEPGEVPRPGANVQHMQCHDSVDKQPEHCVGWLTNQLSEGNNISVRLEMLNCTNVRQLHVDGVQRQSFEEILHDALKTRKQKPR